MALAHKERLGHKAPVKRDVNHDFGFADHPCAGRVDQAPELTVREAQVRVEPGVGWVCDFYEWHGETPIV